MSVFHALDRLHDLQLNVERQRGGDTVWIQLVGCQPLGFDKHLVALLVGKAVNLVFDRGAVARPDALDDPGIHGGAVEVLADDVVRALIGVGDEAVDLLGVQLGAAHERHHRNRCITWLHGHLAEIDTAPVDTRRGAGLQAINSQG